MKALVLIADGTEDIEVVTVVDILRRASVQVNIVGVQLAESYAKTAQGMRVIPDHRFEEMDPAFFTHFDIIILPGGSVGSQTFCKHAGVQALLQSYFAQKKWIAAICAAPLALKTAGVAHGFKGTCYPSLKKELVEYFDYQETPVVVDRQVITSRGPGTAAAFALTILSEVLSSSTKGKIAEETLFH